jgi:D-alanyl-D-alanine endopeptidase (penicillin-binding protein 7)
MKQLLSCILFLCISTANAVPVQNNITAKSFLVTDLKGEVIVEKNADVVQPIASITKLMTAMVVLDANQDLNEQLAINWRHSGKYHTRLPRSVQTLSRHTLLDLAIVKSDNMAAYTLCVNYPGGVDSCIRAMNAKAVSMQLSNTRYADPTGLDVANVSTARELAQLVIQAGTYQHITNASGMPQVSIKVKKRWWQFGNTNPLVRKSDNIRVSKTGYINASGGCLVMLVNTELGERVIVLLNSKNTRTRIPEAAKIAVTVSHSDVEVN